MEKIRACSNGTIRQMVRRLYSCSLAFAGGRLPERCGYRFSEVVPFAKILKRELNRSR